MSEIFVVKNPMGQKLVSIITPTYNCGPKIESTIQSVLSQDKRLYEYVIVDGGSTDRTLPTINKYADDLRLISEKDKGVYDAMNKGIDLTSGKYLYFLGAGDRLRAGILKQIEYSMSGDKLTFIYGNVFREDEGIEYGGYFSRSRLRRENICHQAIFYERAIFDLIGKYDLEYRIISDYAFNIKCFGNNKIKKKFIDYVIADFEGGGLSVYNQGEPNFNHSYLIRSHLGTGQYLLHEAGRVCNRLKTSFRYRTKLASGLIKRILN